MAKHRIPKNLTDADMYLQAQEKTTFETDVYTETDRQSARVKTTSKVSTSDFHRGFLSEKVAERIGELMLQIKMEYYREEIVDFSVEVRKEGRNIVLVTAPKKHQKRI